MSERIVHEPHIRDASLRDVGPLLPLMQAYWAFEQVEGFKPGRIRKQLEEFLATPRFGRLWVAEAQGQLVAYVVLAYVYSFEYGGRMAEFDELYVVENWRGAGLGRRLMDAGREALSQEGCVAVQLQVADWNEAGQRFYRREGFAPKRGYRLWVAPINGPHQG